MHIGWHESRNKINRNSSSISHFIYSLETSMAVEAVTVEIIVMKFAWNLSLCQQWEALLIYQKHLRRSEKPSKKYEISMKSIIKLSSSKARREMA